jgi:hypothetical protein
VTVSDLVPPQPIIRLKAMRARIGVRVLTTGSRSF